MTAPDAATLSLRRRAELRGLEALAQSRVNVGVWTARLLGSLGIFNGVLSALFGLGAAYSIGWLLWGIGIHASAYRMQRGSRIDPWVLIGLLVIGDIAHIASGRADAIALLVAGAALVGLAMGAKGTTTLARIRRDQLEAESQRAAV